MLEYTNTTFKQMRDDLNNHFQEIVKDNNQLFIMNIDTEKLWELYLESFPNEIKGIYRERAWHDCTACKKFFKKIANTCTITKNEDDEYVINTLFDFETIKEYAPVMSVLNDYICENISINNIFITSHSSVGIDENYEETEDGTIIKHNHLFVTLPSHLINPTPNIVKGEYVTLKQVLESSLNTIKIEAINTVLDLIGENNLYRGQQWEQIIKQFKLLLIEYNNITDSLQKELFLWYNADNPLVSKLKNQSIGVLLQDISNGMDLEGAVAKYESIVAPSNYQRPKSLFTEMMVKEAEKTLTNLGFVDCLNRRYATLSDVPMENILYLNKEYKNKITNDTVFDELLKEATHKPKEFKHLEEIPLKEFIKNILPNINDLSLYFDTSKINNLVSLITSDNPQTMFKWDNNFSWSYKDNLTDSNIKENVKKMGGDVDVDLRFSIQWNDNTNEHDRNDLDAHCTEPNRNEIYYANNQSKYTRGWLDIDIQHPVKNKVAVENIQFKYKNHLLDGDYLFSVHQFAYRGGDDGFKAELEVDGETYNFNYPFRLSQDETVPVAKVHYDKNNDKFTVTDLLKGKVENIREWNININTYAPVSLVCYSPNYWDDNHTGNEHIFLFLKDCINYDSCNGYYNEFLTHELSKHRKVMEALSSKAKAEYNPNQLSGVGFSTTLHNSFICKINYDGVEKIIKVVI